MPRSRAAGRRNGRKKPKNNLISLLKDVGDARKPNVRVKKKPFLVQNMGSEGTVTIEKTTVIKSTATETSTVVNDIMSGGVPAESSNVTVSFKPKGSDVKCNMTIHEEELSYLEKNLLGPKEEPIEILPTPPTLDLITAPSNNNQNENTKVIHIEKSPIVTKKSGKKGKVRGRLIVKRTTVIELTPKNSARDMIPPIVRALFAPKEENITKNLDKQLTIAKPKSSPETPSLTVDMEKMLNKSIVQDGVQESVAQDCDAMADELDNLMLSEPFDFKSYFGGLDDKILLSLGDGEKFNTKPDHETTVQSNILVFCQSQYVSAPATVSSKITNPLQNKVSECKIFLKRSGTVHMKRIMTIPESQTQKRTVTTYMRFHTSLTELKTRKKSVSETVVSPLIVEVLEDNSLEEPELTDSSAEPELCKDTNKVNNVLKLDLRPTDNDCEGRIEIGPSLSPREFAQMECCQVSKSTSIEEVEITEAPTVKVFEPIASEVVTMSEYGTETTLDETESMEIGENVVHVLETSVMYNSHQTMEDLFKPLGDNLKIPFLEPSAKEVTESNEIEITTFKSKTIEEKRENKKEEEINFQLRNNKYTSGHLSFTSPKTTDDLYQTRASSFGTYRKASLPTLPSTSAAFRYASKRTRSTFYDSVIPRDYASPLPSRSRLNEGTERWRHLSSMSYGRCLLDRSTCTSSPDVTTERKSMSLRFGPARPKMNETTRERFPREITRPSKELTEPDVSSLIRWQLYRDNEFEKIASILPRCKNHGNIAV